MIATELALGRDHDAPGATEPLLEGQPTCYSVTVFTQRWKEIRDFYVEILDARVLSERPERYCEMEIGGIPLCLRKSEYGEMVSYFHLYLSLKNSRPVLDELRRRG